ncbi:MAG: sulfotransferase [Chloroflexi bacterium]|nr:sulfotransferase [Chloroflexota bacterium]
MILITGTQRAGTSWVANVLSRAPHLALIDEPFNKRRLTPGICAADFPYFFTYLHAGNAEPFRPHIERTLGFRYNFRAALRAARSAKAVWRAVRQGQAFNKQRGKTPLVKQPTGMYMAEWLHHTFDMRVVVMVRHPAGYVSSRKRLGFTHDFRDVLDQPDLMAGPLAGFREEVEAFAAAQTDVVDQSALLWKLVYAVAADYREQYPQWVFVRHEDLAADPAVGFADLCQRLAVPFSPAMRETVAELSSTSNPAEVDVAQWKSLKRDSRAVARVWKDRLTPEEIARIRQRVQPVASRFYTEAEWA